MANTSPPTDVSEPAETIADDDICPICHLLLFQPVRTQCNHLLCGSCMAQWAEVSTATMPVTRSSFNTDLSDFNPNYAAIEGLSHIEAACPMCRTATTASLDNRLERELKGRYPVTYAERRVEEEALRVKSGDEGDGVEGMTILIGNKHRLLRVGEEVGNKHDWTFFVRTSRPEIVQEVRIDLHPTFRPPFLTLTQPPFEVRRIGWGYFNIECSIKLKEPYSWLMDEPVARGRPRVMTMDWMLDFDGRGKQRRIRAKVKKMVGQTLESEESMEVSEDRMSPVAWPHMDEAEL